MALEKLQKTIDKSEMTGEEKLLESFLLQAEAIETKKDLEQLIEFIAELIKSVKDSQAFLEQKAEENHRDLRKFAQEATNQEVSSLTSQLQQMETSLQEIETKAKADLDKLSTGVFEEITSVRDSIPEPTDLTNLEASVSDVNVRLTKLTKPEILRDRLTSLEGEGRLDKSAIRGLEEELKAIRALPRGGGGVSAMGVRQAFKYIFHTEAPVGDIDGANTTYTVSNVPFAVVSFSLNGETIAELPNYTVAGKTITFSTAIPAAYSGKDFEVKYIG